MGLHSSAFQYSSNNPDKILAFVSVYAWHDFLESLKIEERHRALYNTENDEVSCVLVFRSQRHSKGLQFRHEPFQSEYDVVGPAEPLSRRPSSILSRLYRAHWRLGR